MLLRRGVPLHQLSRLARGFSQSAAAMQETVAEAAADKNVSRKERLSLMESFARKHLKEAGSLPSAYVLLKEFGGAKATANKVLSRLGEEVTAEAKDETPSNAEASPDEAKTTTAVEAGTQPAQTNKGNETGTLDASEERQAEQVDAKAREPTISLWQKLHSLSYGKPSSPPTPPAPGPAGAGKRAASTKPKPSSKIKELITDSSEESDSETDSDSDVSLLNFPEPESNPAQPLFRTDLQARHGLYIKFLSPQATESDVRGAFRSCGDIHRVQVVRGRNPASKYVYAFVDFATEDALKAALKKEVMIKGSKVMTETAIGNIKTKEKASEKQESDSDSDSEPEKSRALTTRGPKADAVEVTPDPNVLRRTLAVQNIPHASLPQIVEVLSQHGEIVNSRTKQRQGGNNTTAFIEFKNECDKDNALAASKVLLAGKTLRMSRIDVPPTTVVRLSNIPADACGKVASTYKSYGQVDKVDTRMDGVLDIYYNGSELKNMPRILDKLNAIYVSKKKLRAVPAPISYPKTLAEAAETPAGYKWIEAQRELVTKNLELCLKKAAMYSQDLQELLKLQKGGAAASQVKSIASN